jgi:Lysylphosphatidylglycerol synthase TM region
VKLKETIALLRSPLGRAAAAAVGVVAVGLLLAYIGPAQVLRTIQEGAAYLPIVMVLEACVLACTMLALRSLYGEDRHGLHTGILTRAGLAGYVAMSLVPAGRTVAEALRATILSRHSSGPKAAVAALQIQGSALMANGVASLIATVAIFRTVGPGPLGIGAMTNSVLALGAGLLILLGGRVSRLGHHMGRLWPRIETFGRGFDEHFSLSEALPVRAVLWEFLGRMFQILQYVVMVGAVGGVFSLRPALIAEGIHLTATTAGDLIPAQLGATEANFALCAHTLNLPVASAVAIALMAHLVQLFWVLAAVLILSLWPGSRDLMPTSLPLQDHPEAS